MPLETLYHYGWIVIAIVFVLILGSWVAHNVDIAKRDGVGWREGVKDAGAGCGVAILKTVLAVLAIAVVMTVFGAMPSCGRHPGWNGHYHR